MQRYNPKDIEPKWQKSWAEAELYKAVDFDESRQKYVMLTEFPYPSGDGLHLGHVREYTLGDIMARHKRMLGYNVLYPMGYDAFGLPTENFAIKNKIAPQLATERNISNFRKQFDSLGYSIDWSRSFSTTDPDYYKWTQWLFLQFVKAGLAYQDEIAINWCPKCKTGLANEEVVNGRHERCDTPVEKKLLKQWLLKITDYADRLIDGLMSVDYPPRIADQQVNWIGRSRGAEIIFDVQNSKHKITVFTTRPDTLFGATFMVIAPEHPLVDKLTAPEEKSKVIDYVKATEAKSEIERQDTDREKTGVFTGSYAINPINQQKIPIWVADYVLMGYGTGAIMAVPAHDERDNEFASVHNLPVVTVVEPVSGKKQGDEVEKDAIVAVVHNPKTDEYLMLDWGPRQDRFGGNLFIGGGMDEGEDPVTCAAREIAEETGYTNVKHVTTLPYVVHSYYYSNVKNKNYYAKMHGLLFELVDDSKSELALDEGEKNKFKPFWVNRQKAAQLVDDDGHSYIFEALTDSLHYTGEGIMTNSGKYDGTYSSEARERIVKDLVKAGKAEERTNYRLRDWIFSRQHYWGEPIPIIHCQKDGAVPVPDDQLPVTLPEVDNYEPTDTGESPLAAIDEWVNVSCPICGGPAKRETDTMPNWAGSSWYYLRYYDARNDQAFADREKLDYWGAVDLYLGGMEHTTLHLLYSRFWHQFFYDQGLVPTPEPYQARRGQGIVLAADGTKMSKSKGNIVNPTDIIDQGYGADALRVAIAFLAPYDQTTPWSPEGVAGTYRFLNRVWTLAFEYLDSDTKDKDDKSNTLAKLTHPIIKKVSEDLHDMAFNTAISALMELTNALYKHKAAHGYENPAWRDALLTLIKLTAPFAPHMTEELWHQLGQKGSVHVSDWPMWDDKFLKSDTITIAVQVNGKVRAEIDLPSDITEEKALQIARENKKVAGYLADHPVKKAIYIPGKIINFVI